MPLEDRDYMRGKHPPACTCVACARRRVGRLQRRRTSIAGRIMDYLSRVFSRR